MTRTQLTDALGQSAPGEEAVLFNQVPDGNGGQPLPNNPLFGEVVAGTPIVPPAQTAREVMLKAVPAQDVTPMAELVAPTLPEAMSE